MYCRACKNIRQNKYGGGIYCSLKDSSVGLNQVCNIDKFELDRALCHIELDDNTRIDVNIGRDRYQIFNYREKLNVVSCNFCTTLKADSMRKDNIEITMIKEDK